MQDNHIKFADKYFETLNASKSAIYAGFSEDTAKQSGYQLLQRDDIQEYLTALRAEYAEKTGITKQRVLNEVAKIAFSDIRNYYTGDDKLKPITDLDDNEAAALASVKTYEEYSQHEAIGMNKEIKLYNKLDGLEKLARHLGLYEKDNQQAATRNNVILTKETVKEISDKLDDNY